VSQPEDAVEQPDEQLLYARSIAWASHAGLALLVFAFVAYVSGLLNALVPLDRLPALWSLPVARYLQETGTPTGWGWTGLMAHGDMLCLLGIAVLASAAMPGLLLLQIFAKRGERALAAVCALEAAVVVLAASGWLAGGH
jgi:hypothetical protein